MGKSRFNSSVFVSRFKRYGSEDEHFLYVDISNDGHVDGFCYSKAFEDERKYLTMDDATMLHHCAYSVEDVDLEDLISEALNATYVFEAGLDIRYEGLWKERLFSTFSAAKAWAETLTEYATGCNEEIFADARMVIGEPK